MLVLSRPLDGSNRIMNTDNLYTDVRGMLQLKQKGIYSRGTFRRNRKHIPEAILFTKGELKSASRGDYRVASDSRLKIVGASWVDGNEVNVMSNADGTEEGAVQRQIGMQKMTIMTLMMVWMYNKYMQGIDRVDQYRARFSLTDGHSFQKWHIKMAFGFIDFARVNSFLTRKLFAEDKDSKMKLDGRDPHRQHVEDLALQLLSGEWKNCPDQQIRLLAAEPIPDQMTGSMERSFFSPTPKHAICVSL